MQLSIKNYIIDRVRHQSFVRHWVMPSEALGSAAEGGAPAARA